MSRGVYFGPFIAAGDAFHRRPEAPSSTPDEDPRGDDGPIGTTNRARTFRLRDAAALLFAFTAIWCGMVVAFALGLIPPDVDWANGLTGVLLAGTAGAVLFVARRRGIRIRDLLLHDRPWYLEVRWGVGVAILMIVAMQILHWFRVPLADPLMLEESRESLASRLAILLIASILAPLGEELLFRGVIQSSLVPRVGWIAACLIQTVLFAAFHPRGWTLAIVVAISGIVLGASALKRRCLLPAMTTHFVINLCSGVWLVALSWLNAHVPATTMAEARTPPTWIGEATTFGMPKEVDAYHMATAIDFSYGDEGLLLRKDEIKAQRYLRAKFPREADLCAYSMVREGTIYVSDLGDPRRAVLLFEEALDRYPDAENARLAALWGLAECRIQLGEIDRAREIFGHLEWGAEGAPEFQPYVDHLRERLRTIETRSEDPSP